MNRFLYVLFFFFVPYSLLWSLLLVNRITASQSSSNSCCTRFSNIFMNECKNKFEFLLKKKTSVAHGSSIFQNYILHANILCSNKLFHKFRSNQRISFHNFICNELGIFNELGIAEIQYNLPHATESTNEKVNDKLSTLRTVSILTIDRDNPKRLLDFKLFSKSHVKRILRRMLSRLIRNRL